MVDFGSFDKLAQDYELRQSAEKVYPHYVLFCAYSDGEIKEYPLYTEDTAMKFFYTPPSLYYGEYPDSVALYRVRPKTSIAGATLIFLKYKKYHREYKYCISLVTNKYNGV